MRILVQRVSRASVTVEGKIVGRIQRGLLLLVGFREGDGEPELAWMVRKVANLRVLADEAGKMNLSLIDVAGEALVVSQFTLYADTRKGNRPSYLGAAGPEIAEPLYERFCELLAAAIARPVARGVFGAQMDVELVNDGPVTIALEREAKP